MQVNCSGRFLIGNSMIANSMEPEISPSYFFVSFVAKESCVKAKSPALAAQGFSLKKQLDGVSQWDGIFRLQIAQTTDVLTQGLIFGHQHCRSQLQ